VVQIDSYKNNRIPAREMLGWEEYLAYADTLVIFISNSVNYSESIIQQYSVTLQNLKHLNWILYYPPTEAMKDMKMYPPYKAMNNFE
jgi:hypothetical protein